MQFKKVYIEITNICNLNCSFCQNTQREKRYMTIEQFEYIIKQVKRVTEYVYLHVKGEPLLHPELVKILKICSENKIKVNITTNGTLLKDKGAILLNADCIRQLNISLHSENNLPNYMMNVCSVAKKLSKKMYICYRLWTLTDYKLDKKSTEIVDKTAEEYKLSPETVEKIYEEKSVKIDFNTFVNKDNLFKWPTLLTKGKNDNYCYGLTTHIGILVDGTVVPCCLDGEGIINLGNIFEKDLDDILESERAQNLLRQFKNNKCSEELCSKCTFKNKFNH